MAFRHDLFCGALKVQSTRQGITKPIRALIPETRP